MPGVQRFVLCGAALALGTLGLYYGQSLLIPLALAALLALALYPAVSRLRRWLPQKAAVAVVMTLAVTGLLGAGALTAIQMGELGQELPTHRKNIQQKLRDLRPVLMPSGTTKEVTKLVDMVSGEVEAATRGLSLPGAPDGPVTQVTVETQSGGQRAMAMLMSVGVQLATGALTLILAAIMLLQRAELRDRVLRLLGGDPHRMGDALSESAQRVSRYLVAQLMVNLGYGLPMALGLWWIGVPGAWLWGALAAVLRFVPYLGPALGALFPLVLAFAVDPGWSMVMWTLALIVVLEAVSNNIVEPLAYGSSTGVSPMAVLLSAAFWATLWGPVGLVLATPLTVCLVVMGRHLAPLRFLDVLFSSTPAFDSPTQLYHRLLAGHPEEAHDMAREQIQRHTLPVFVRDTALPMLALAARDQAQGATASHRHRLLTGMARIVDDLQAGHPAASAPVLACVGAGTEQDALAADLLAATFAHAGLPSVAVTTVSLQADAADPPALQTATDLVLCALSEEPRSAVRALAQRVRQHRPELRIHLFAPDAPVDLLAPQAAADLGVDSVFVRLDELLLHARDRASASTASVPHGGHDESGGGRAPTRTTPDPSGGLLRSLERAATAFRVPRVSLTLRLDGGHVRCALAGDPERPGWCTEPAPAPLSPLGRVLGGAPVLTLDDLHLDPRHLGASHRVYEGLGAFAGVALADESGTALGVLALHAPAGHRLTAPDLALLGELARDLKPAAASLLQQEANHRPVREPSGAPASALSYVTL